jgi:hypothetical protein
MTTADRVLTPGWWPTKGIEPRDHYVGAETCEACHKQIAETPEHTSMAHTARLASSGEVSSTGVNGPLVFRVGPYSYEIAKTAVGLSYSVTDGNKSQSASLGWVFGSGHFGQTYLYQKTGTYYESHLSYFSTIQSLDFTTGHARVPSPNFEKALADPLDPDTTRKCFGCHTTASTTGGRFDPNRLMLGVACEACHGPGAQHVCRDDSGTRRPIGDFHFESGNIVAFRVGGLLRRVPSHPPRCP